MEPYIFDASAVLALLWLARAPARLRRASRLCSRRLGGPEAPSRRCASQGPRRIRFPGAGRPSEFRGLSRRFCRQAKRRDPREGNEPGQKVVREHLHGGCILAVNWSEALAKRMELGVPADTALQQMGEIGLAVVPFDQELARLTALLQAEVRGYGLSFADRACLALGRKLELPVLTADRTWARLRMGVRVRVIR